MAIKVLYVDDEPDNLLSFRSLFRRFLSVRTVDNGEDALALLDEEEFDVLLSDQRMPSMTGLELCEQAKEKFPTMKRYIVTGFSESSPLEEALHNGTILSVIMKPWDFQEMKQLLQA